MGRAISALVVEDEALIRSLTVEALQGQGFTVSAVGSAKEAITILEAKPEIGLLFTDIQLNGTMNGLELAHRVQKRWPTTVIVVNSGYVFPREGALPSGVRFLPKPYTFSDLTVLADDVKKQLQ